MEPNSNFPNESFSIFGSALIAEKSMLDKLRDKYKVIDDEEYKYCAFVFSNFHKKSIVRKSLFKGLQGQVSKYQALESQTTLNL